MRILVVEDESGIARFLSEGLTEEGYAVDLATNGNAGLEKALSNQYDLLLLDWMLPGISGIELCRRFRKENASTPVIFLTVKDSVDETVFGLKVGANDFVKKPFAFDELLARIKVQLRQKSGEPTVLTLGPIVLNPETRQVTIHEQSINLTPREFSLLEFLMQNRGKVCTRTRILDHVWGINYHDNTSVIDVYINYLRKKLGVGGPCIHTIRGVGFIAKDDE